MAQLSIHQRITENLYIQSIRSAFIALIPIMLLSATLILLNTFSYYFGLDNTISRFISGASAVSTRLFPILVMIALSYFLGRSLNKSPIVTVFVTTLCYFALDSGGFYDGLLNGEQYIPFQPYSIILPFLTTWLLRKTYKIKWLRMVYSTQLSSHLRVHLNLILPCMVTFILVCSLIAVLEPGAKLLITPIVGLVNESSLVSQSIFQITMSNLFWFVGIHGDNTYNLLFEPYFLSADIFPNLMAGTMIDLFSAAGGSGPGISLILAILIYSKDREARKIAKVSAPFCLFNISEILIYGLPIVFNPYLFIPFMLVPIIQFFVAYFAISIGLVEFSGTDFVWITPAIINSYIASGNYSAIILQIICIGLGTYIFSPFIKRGHSFNHDAELATSLAHKLSVKAPFDSADQEQQDREEQKSFRRNITEEIMTGELFLSYSPVFSANTLKQPESITEYRHSNFEVHINLKCGDGRVVGKELINELHGHLSEGIVYTWAFKKLTEQLGEWQQEGYYPKLHLPLNRGILSSTMFVESIISIFSGRSKQLVLSLADEILSNDLEEHIQEHLKQLKDAGFTLSLNQYEHDRASLLHLSDKVCSQVNISLKSLGSSLQAQQLLPALCQFYRSLDLQIHLCDINTREYRAMIEEIDADMYQGQALGTPLSAREL